MFKRIFSRMKGILMLFAGSIALLAIALMLDFKTFEQFNFYQDVDVWTHPILIFQLVMIVIVLLLLGQVIGLSVKYYFAFKKLDALFPNNEWEQKDFKEKADYVDEKFEAMIVEEVLIFYGSHFTVIPLKELKKFIYTVQVQGAVCIMESSLCLRQEDVHLFQIRMERH